MASAKQARGWRARSLGPNPAKLTVPRLGRVLSRTRLLKQCDRLTAHKLVWIAAPAGSGKTTLLVDYLGSRKPAHLWYQVDAGDRDIASFFNNLATAVERGGRLKRKLTRFTPEYALGLPAFSRNFFRELFARLKTPACIVFDNYQDVGEAAMLDEVLAHALDELPEGITIIAMSRSALPAALARHDANGQVAHLDAAALALTAEEEAVVVKLTLGERRLKPADLGRLCQATHGWMAGLLLALREVRARAVGEEAKVIDAITHASAQDPAHIFDYFASEVMARLDMATRDFLYAVALFPAMTAALCEQLTGNQKAKTILQRLVHEHFFTTRRGLLSVSYEFHPLFRQFLLAQVENNLDSEQLQTLKRRAGQLLAEAGEAEAVALLVATQHWSTLTALICTHGAELEKQGRHRTLQEWIAVLPEEQRVSDPWLLYWGGIAQLPTDPFAAYELFERAYPQFSEQEDVLGLYLCWNGATTALFFRNDDMSPAPGWIVELERLRARHPKWPSLEVQARVTTAAIAVLITGDVQNPLLPEWVARAEKLYRFIPIGAVRCFVGAQLGLYYSIYGQLDKLSVLVAQLKPLIASPKIPDAARFLAAAISVFDAWQKGNLPAINEAVSQGSSLLEESGVHVMSQWFFLSAAMVKISHADLEGAEEFIERFRKNTNPRHRSDLAFHEHIGCWRALLRGEFAMAKAHSETTLALLEPLHNAILLIQALGENVQVLIELGEFSGARTSLDKMRRLSLGTGNLLFSEFYAYYLEAYLLDKSGASLDEILPALQRSFSAGAKHQWVVNMSWQPRMMARLCDIALQHHIEPEYAKRLIRIYHLVPPASEAPIEHWPWPIKIRTLGRFGITLDDKPLRFTGKVQKKPLELLMALVSFGGREVSEMRLCEALWADADADAAHTALAMALHRLRKLLGDDDAVLLSDNRLSLNPGKVWVDAWTFERVVARAASGTSTASDVQRVLNLYQGTFLGEAASAPWALATREKLRAKFLRFATQASRLCLQEGRHEEALRLVDQGLEAEPLAEELYRSRMRCQAASGRRAEALATYQRCEKTLATLLGIEPAAETRALYQALRENRPLP